MLVYKKQVAWLYTHTHTHTNTYSHTHTHKKKLFIVRNLYLGDFKLKVKGGELKGTWERNGLKRKGQMV